VIELRQRELRQPRRIGGFSSVALPRCRAAPVVRGPGSRPTGGDEEPGCAGDLAVEIARIELGTPYRFVHGAQLADGELGGAEGGGQRGVLELGAGASLLTELAQQHGRLDLIASSRVRLGVGSIA